MEINECRSSEHWNGDEEYCIFTNSKRACVLDTVGFAGGAVVNDLETEIGDACSNSWPVPYFSFPQNNEWEWEWEESI